MENTNEKLLAFLKDNPNSGKAAITEATGLSGLHLFNVLKKLQNDGLVIQNDDGDEKTFSVADFEQTKEMVASDEQPSSNSRFETDDTEAEGSEHTETAENPETSEQPTETEQNSETEQASTSKGRDNSKLSFNNEFYGKGPLVRAVVAQYVKDHPNTTYDKLKKVFPDELLKRFGIFQDEETAERIANGGPRYFTKPEQVIKLKDKSVVVCSQFTLANIQPFLKVAKELGYQIE